MAWFRGTQVVVRCGEPLRIGVREDRFAETYRLVGGASRGRLKIQIDDKSRLPAEDWPKLREKRLFEIAARRCDSWRGA
jgi:hypothetical protein